jgi:hypothetical protein
MKRIAAWIGAALTVLGGGGTALYYTTRQAPQQGPPPWAAPQARENAAKAILVCTVDTVTPVAYTTPEGDQTIASEVTCRDARAIKGEVPPNVTITVMGGTLNGVTMTSEHERVPNPGERIRFFLNEHGGRQRLVGMPAHPGMEVEP